MTGDDHGNGGTAGRFDQYLAASPAGCSVANWECVRSTSYVYPNTPLTQRPGDRVQRPGLRGRPAPQHQLRQLHPDHAAELLHDPAHAIRTAKYSGVPAPVTNRAHCIPWSDWASMPKAELEHGMRLDTNYYYWPPALGQQHAGPVHGIRHADALRRSGFRVAAASGAVGLRGMVPATFSGKALRTLTRDGSAVSATNQTIKGVDYAFFPATSGQYAASYEGDTTPPTVSAVAATARPTGPPRSRGRRMRRRIRASTTAPRRRP